MSFAFGPDTWMEGEKADKAFVERILGKNMTIKEWQTYIHGYAKSKGWWPLEGRSRGEIYANIFSEIAEAWEFWRDSSKPPVFVDSSGKPDGEAIELADCIIRILDYAEQQGWDMEELIKKKMEYNQERPFRHGGKRA